MSCYGNYRGRKEDCFPSPEHRIKQALDQFKGNERKALKLLIKQYNILSIDRQEETIFTHDLGGRKMMITADFNFRYVIKYTSFKDHERKNVFEWNIEINN